MLSGKRFFITGGAGFIGSTLVGRLLDDNEVVIYDNLARNSLAQRSFARDPRLRVIEGDVLDETTLREAVQSARPTHVVHAAAIAGIDTVIVRPVHTLEVNMVGAVNLLNAVCGLDGLERVLCFSTSEVFGRHAFLTDEGDGAVIGSVGEARWTYAVSKLATEHLALAHHKQNGAPVVVVRPFNVYGPGQVGEGALSTFVQRAIRGEDLEIQGDGNQIRAWCYIDDMVRALLIALEHPAAVGETFNIGNQRAVVTVYLLASTVVRILDAPSKIRFTERDHVDVELRVPNVGKARDLLGFEAEVGLEDGIRRTAESYRQEMRNAS